MQLSGDAFYDDGLFPTQRVWNFSQGAEEDNTIFFTASILHTLAMLEPFMSLEEQVMANEIKGEATVNYQKYQSRNKEPTYNFWQTVPPDLPFPNGSKWISNVKMRLPDDLDTSIIIALSSNSDSIKIKLRKKMIAYAARENRAESKLNTLKKYKNSRAYEVWFAKDMPQTFDLCVLANALLFIFDESYPLNQYDSASIDLIKQMIIDDDHRKHPTDIAHHTSSEALILYHVARLIQKDKTGIFETIQMKVTDHLIDVINSSNSEFEKMLATSSLIRLNGYAAGDIDQSRLLAELDSFVFFSVKPFLTNQELSFLNGIVPDIHWISKAYNYTLYLEYLYLNKTYVSNLSGGH